MHTAALGLIAMEERAASLGGRLQVYSALGAGTTVRLECPLVPGH
jgi:signal transduction histidine kinase